jgi:prepilin-type N-terminal cleavage/methylation domain-containing protein
MVLKRGFSLIELIVVIGLLGLLMLAISSTMLMSIVSSNRVRVTTKTKQAGNYAIGQIQGLIRNAKDLTACSTGANTVTITNPDGNSTQIFAENSRIASGSGTYLTPANLAVSAGSFKIICLPDTTPPATPGNITNLIKISFDLNGLNSVDSIQTPSLHFETSINLRNE